jgi:hypothetical protein
MQGLLLRAGRDGLTRWARGTRGVDLGRRSHGWVAKFWCFLLLDRSGVDVGGGEEESFLG